MRQIRFITARRSQLALRRISVFIDIDTSVHLLCLLWRDGSSLGCCTAGRCRHLLSFTLPRTFDSVTLRIRRTYLWNCIVTLSWSPISEGMAHPGSAKLLFEVLLGLLGNQLSSLRSAGASHRRATANCVAVALPISDGPLFGWLVRQSVYH